MTPSSQPAVLRRPAVLLVDDAKVVLRVVERALAVAGFSLRVAEDAETALRLLDEEEEFACALIDRNLVGADGLDLIKRIRERQRQCACVVMTAYPSVASAVEALRIGVVDYIQKPSPEFERIADRVQKAIRLHRMRDEEPSRAGSRATRRAEEVVAALRALRAEIKPRGRAAYNRALAEAEAHAAALRDR